MNDSQDTEITLSTGKVLGIFVALVAVCGLFFGLGYSLGRGSAKQAGSLIADNAPGTAVTNPGAKPGASQGTSAQSGSEPQDLTFYKAVEQKDANTQLAPAEQPSNAQAQQPATQPAKSAPELSSPAAPVGSGYMVQIAAVSKREDADMLKSALQQKQYPVIITSAANDKLFHVQVGPFSDIKDAEQMKARLTSDGYNPIVKR